MFIPTSTFLRLIVGTTIILSTACSSEKNDTADTNPEIHKTEAVAVTEQHNSAISLSGADAERGKRFFLQCRACHTIAEGGEHLIGPNLWGIVGSPAGKKSDFQYSEGLQQANFSWDLETLDRFLIKPSDLLPGTTMIFAGINDPSMRKDVLAYLVEAGTKQETRP